MKDCIALIGMPGAGKSTVGVLLAKQLGMDFLDTDIAIQNREGKTLQQILDQSSYLHLRQIEEQPKKRLPGFPVWRVVSHAPLKMALGLGSVFIERN